MSVQFVKKKDRTRCAHVIIGAFKLSSLMPWFFLQLYLQDSEACNNFDVILGSRDTVHINGRYQCPYKAFPTLAFMEKIHLFKEIILY